MKGRRLESAKHSRAGLAVAGGPTALGAALAAVLGAALLAACVHAPPVRPPQPLLEDRAGLTGPAADPAPDGWWKGLGDPQLDALVVRALDQNPTLAEARSRLQAAAEAAEAAHSGLLPQANLDGSLIRQHAPQNYLIPSPLAGTSSWMGQAGLSLSWDLDLWGRQKAAIDRAHDLTQVAELDLESSRLILAGALMQAYVELDHAYALADIAQRSEAQRQTIIDVTRRRVAAGIDTRLEMRLAEGQLPQARVDHTRARADVAMAVHELAALSGAGAEAYGDIERPTMDIQGALPIPNALPINLLARRPDVLAARMTVDAADAQRRAARAAFYPDVSLRALAGIGAFGLDNLVKWSARGYGGGPLISLPIFDGGRLRADYRGSEAELDGAIGAYNDTVLHAVQQTADQLTRIDALAREITDQAQTLSAAEDAYRIAERRYRAGLASYLSVLNAETQVLAARRTMVDLSADQLLARVNLLLAVGGSFDPSRSTATAALSPSTRFLP